MTNYDHKIYESERLTYQLMTADDIELMLDLDNDPEVMEYITGKVTTRQEMIDIFIPRMESYRDPKYGWGLWKVFTKDTNEFIGWFLIRPMAEEPTKIEIGWRLKKCAWGKGYGTEGARLFMDHAFKQPDTTHLYAIAHPENEGSHHIMKKLGLTYIKTFKYESSILSCDVVYYEYSREDYLQEN